MEFPEYLDNSINNMRKSKKKELWENLRNSNRVYTQIPTPYELEDRSKYLTSYMQCRSLPALEYSLDYYLRVKSAYSCYDFILSPAFFESTYNVNDIDLLYVSDKSRKQVDNICKRLSKKIIKLKK